MANAADVLIRILGESKGLTTAVDKSKQSIGGLVKEVDKSKGAISAFGNVIQGVFQGIGQALFASVVGGVRAAVGEIGKGISAASDLQESVNKVTVVFGDSSKEILEWSRVSSTALGQSQQQALESAGTFGNLFRSMGITRDAAKEMSIGLVELAADLASFNNISSADALTKLTSGIVGELEPVRALGVDLSVAAVEAKAFALGLGDSYEALTQQEKVLARYQIILEQTQLAQGDFSRTSDELANSQRILAAQIADTSASFGRALLPVQLAFTRGLSELIEIVTPYGENIMDSLAAGLARGIVSILPVLQQVRALFTYWLKPGSPPRLLKELTEWGSGAMQAYLEGWGKADFGALSSLGGVFENALRSFASSGDIKETDLVSRVFGTQKALARAISDFRNLGTVTEETFGAIDQAAGPAGGAVSRLAREYFELQKATQRVSDAQDELNGITDRYAEALDPITGQLDAVRAKQREIRDNQRLEELGKIIKDKRTDADDRQLARLEAEEIQLERQATALERERDAAVDGAQDKIDAAKQEEAAQQQKFDIAQQLLDQQTKTNSLIADETALRQRLIDEGLAEQKRVMAELEAEQRKAEQAERALAAELERVADAQLRYNLASTDTAGQLEIMRGELAKTVTGSAEYFDILTQIVGLEERLKKERDSAGGGLLGPLQEAVGAPGELQATSKGIQELSAALDAAFKALSGGDGQTVELAPAWQGFADTLGNIGQAAQDVVPFIQSLIAFVTGDGADNSNATADILRPTGNSNIFSSIYSAVTGLITNLKLVKDGDWATLWSNFKQLINDNLAASVLQGDVTSIGFYSYLTDTLIPALEALRDGDWRKAWESFGGTAVEAMVAGFLGNEKVAALMAFQVKFVTGDIFGAIEELKKLGVSVPTPSAPSGEPSGPSGMPETQDDWYKAFIEALRRALPTILPGMPPGYSPQSFNNFPGADSLVPAMAGASSVTNGASTVNNILINQQIGINGDVGGARQGAQMGIREALIDRRLT